MKTLVFLLAFLCVLTTDARSPKRYMYNGDFSLVSKHGCQYALVYKTDSNQRFDFYNCSNQLVMRKHFSLLFNPKKMSTASYFLQGEAIQFHANGQKASVVNYDKGQKSGEEFGYDTAGRLMSSGTYKNGLRYSGSWLKTSASEYLSFEHFYRSKHQKTVVLNASGDTSTVYHYRYDGQTRLLESAHYYNEGRFQRIKTFSENYRDSFFTSGKKDSAAMKKSDKKDSGRMQVVSFRGGEEGLLNYLNEQLQYPRQAMLNNHQGIVMVCFVVGRENNIVDLFTRSNVNADLIAEALRVFEGTEGLWISGHYDGKPVVAFAKLPITFQID